MLRDGSACHTWAVRERCVLHVLPIDLSRGAQTYARELRLTLDDADTAHRTLTLFRSPEGGALRPDVSLDVPSGFLRKAGVDARAWYRLRRFLRDEKPDVVVAHGGEPLKYAVFAGVPRDRLVYYKIGIGGARLRGSRGLLHRALLRRAGTIAAVSGDAAQEVDELGVATEPVHVIPNGRDPERFHRVEPPADDAPRFVFLGHLTPSKRPDRFIELVRTLRAEGLALSACAAGDGPLLDALASDAEQAGVQLLGRVEDVPELLSRADVMVFTSVSEGEGMPGVLIEAGLAGLAVVTTDVPGTGAVVLDGETGFVVPVDDFSRLVDACRTLVTDGELRRRFGAAARVRCARDFSLEASIGQWRDLLAAIDRRQCTSST